jgi:hypothetical protein
MPVPPRPALGRLDICVVLNSKSPVRAALVQYCALLFLFAANWDRLQIFRKLVVVPSEPAAVITQRVALASPIKAIAVTGTARAACIADSAHTGITTCGATGTTTTDP